MARFDPVDPRVRLAIAQWPPDAPRGAVSTFCLEHAISAEDLLRDPATGGRTCVIFQLIDDHSRYAVASHVASGETAEGRSRW